MEYLDEKNNWSDNQLYHLNKCISLFKKNGKCNAMTLARALNMSKEEMPFRGTVNFKEAMIWLNLITKTKK